MTCTWRVDRSRVEDEFAADIERMLGDDPGDWYVTCGARDEATEAAGYARWLADPLRAPKYTNPTNCAHCAQPKAMAVDVTLVENGKDQWDYTCAAWRRIVATAKAHPRIHPGASFGDYDHFQKVGWYALDTRHQNGGSHA